MVLEISDDLPYFMFICDHEAQIYAMHRPILERAFVSGKRLLVIINSVVIGYTYRSTACHSNFGPYGLPYRLGIVYVGVFAVQQLLP